MVVSGNLARGRTGIQSQNWWNLLGLYFRGRQMPLGKSRGENFTRSGDLCPPSQIFSSKETLTLRAAKTYENTPSI